ncbi:MAG TPA: M55 family metallopeptidase [Vicinamibacteria bacterium]|nr:M55 family metallopeptidase [Vicinamibacteria bacterium]
MRVWLATAALCLCGTSGALGTEARGKLKVHVSVDMEGIAGVVSGDQLGPSEFEYQRFREFMTREALAAVQAALEAGATEIVVADSHGNGQNLLIEQLPKDVRVVRSWPRPLGMMGGVDGSFDAAIFIGYHASTDNPKGVRAHTFRSALFTHVGVNGKAISEGWMSAALAGHFGVPVVMASGDDVAMAELRQQLGDLETAEVKRSLGFHAAETLTPAAAVELIGRKVKAALARRGDFKPMRLSGAPALEIGFKQYLAAEVAAYLPGAERMDAHSVRFRTRDILETSNLLTFLDNWDQELKP